jgi:RNA polymerase sigma-70 factor (ECF subfamily)
MQPTTTLSPNGRHLSTIETERLRQLLAAKGLRGADIDDAVQEVHLRVVRSAPSGAGLAPWATRVAINVAMDHHRRQRRARGLGEQPGPASRAAAPEPDVAERLAVTAALAELAPEKRAVVRLHLLADLTIAETARRLAVPEGTVKSRLHRALAELRRLLEVSRDGEPRGPPPRVQAERGCTGGA